MLRTCNEWRERIRRHRRNTNRNMTTTRQTTSTWREVAKFDALASRWWDPEGEFRPLHEINPLRLDWIRQHVDLDGCKACRYRLRRRHPRGIDGDRQCDG